MVPLLKAGEAVGQQIADLDRKVMLLPRDDAQVRRFMSTPGVGPITALALRHEHALGNQRIDGSQVPPVMSSRWPINHSRRFRLDVQ